jgi:hypothetical protein
LTTINGFRDFAISPCRAERRVAVDLELSERSGAATLPVVGIEDLIASPV